MSAGIIVKTGHGAVERGTESRISWGRIAARNFFSRMRRKGLCALLAAATVWAIPSQAASPGLAEDHTIIYYLIEIQRRVTKKCHGEALPEAPSLIPSAALRALVDESAAAGQDATVYATQHGLHDVPFTVLTAGGGSPQQVFSNLNTSSCPRLMGTDFRYIGASQHQGLWTVILAAGEPGEPQPDAAPAAVPEQAASLPKTRADTKEDPRAASPIVIGEIDLDYAGKPVGPLRPLRPGASGTEPTDDPRTSGLRQERLQPSPSQEPASQGRSTEGTQARPGVTPLYDERPQPAEKALMLTEGEGSTPGSGHTPDAALPTGDPDRLFTLINGVRSSGTVCGGRSMPAVKPLRRNTLLSATARAHAEDMVARAYFSSLSPDGVTLGQRLSAAGYRWALIAENIASKRGTEEDVLHTWLNSPEQCANIMAPEYADAGIGADGNRKLWVFTLALPMSLAGQ